MNLAKYIVCFQATRRGSYGDKKTVVQFYQFFAPSAAAAKESADVTREKLKKKSGNNWTIEGIYLKCDI